MTDKEPGCRSTQLPLTHLAKTLTCCDHSLTQTPTLTLTPTVSVTNPDLTMTLIHDLDHISIIPIITIGPSLTLIPVMIQILIWSPRHD